MHNDLHIKYILNMSLKHVQEFANFPEHISETNYSSYNLCATISKKISNASKIFAFLPFPSYWTELDAMFSVYSQCLCGDLLTTIYTAYINERMI